MNARREIMKPAFERASIQAILEKRQELLRELRDLLDAYGPVWYTEELATRLNKIQAKSANSNKQFTR
jgi:hypothetical protein